MLSEDLIPYMFGLVLLLYALVAVLIPTRHEETSNHED